MTYVEELEGREYNSNVEIVPTECISDLSNKVTINKYLREKRRQDIRKIE